MAYFVMIKHDIRISWYAPLQTTQQLKDKSKVRGDFWHDFR